MSKKWEFTREMMPEYAMTKAFEIINEMGSEGWELVSVTITAKGDYYGWFKREVANDETR